ncbi:MAG TPA: metallophosphoesterase family protein [Smithella sp.]|nr:metallophosphoesterase family protein [Smithella sp.]
MLISFISDIHGNLPALEAAVADAKKKGASRIICAGDITGYGPFPDNVCHFLQKRHIPAVMGNYDEKVVKTAKQGTSSTADMKKKKREILLWTVRNINNQNRKYLSNLPHYLDLKFPGGKTILVVHGSPVSMEDAIYPSITKRGLEKKLGEKRPDVLICGHTHIPFVRRIGGILVVNCGSAGHPVDGDPRPSYALIRVAPGSIPGGRIVRFDYDWDRTITMLKKTSLPNELQKDFLEGNKRRFLQ